jgi:hypothetical protein
MHLCNQKPDRSVPLTMTPTPWLPGAVLLGCLLIGCTAPEPPPAPEPTQPPPVLGQAGKHVRLSLPDMTMELEKHCAAAQQSMEKLIEALKDGGADRSRLDGQVLQMRRDMEICMSMVHGMREQHLGEPPSGREQEAREKQDNR